MIEYKKGKENLAADALSRRDGSDKDHEGGCFAIVIMLEWVEDIKGSYTNDPLYEKALGGGSSRKHRI